MPAPSTSFAEEFKRSLWTTSPILIGVLLFSFIALRKTLTSPQKPSHSLMTAHSMDQNAGLILPSGFTATLVADHLGPARHIAVSKRGDLFVKLADAGNHAGIKVLRTLKSEAKEGVKSEAKEGVKSGVKEGVKSEAKGVMKGGMNAKEGTLPLGANQAVVIDSFGDYGGTGIAIKNGYLYTSSNTDIYRYKLGADDQVLDKEHPENIVHGLIERGEHESKSITLDNQGYIYVNIGAYSNGCQVQDRQRGSPAMDPCPILDSAGGIWRFNADRLHQTYADGIRYATGTRNVVGLDWNNHTNQLFVMQHGRDQLHDLFPDLYGTKESAELPAEEMFRIDKGKSYGWPYCYYDGIQHKKLLSPEYGGDGKKVGRCANAENPVIAFPGHLAPNGLLFYTGSQFPERYRNGAFIAFHGSWNRAPEPQKGYFVVFVPFQNGLPSGKWEIFADHFAGVDLVKSPGQAKHRPCGLAQGPDGSLYVTDDHQGSIFKIQYTAHSI